MYYTIYKTTNLLNNKFYIGKHQTTDLEDNYLGSGKLLKRAIKKYGIDNFQKEILFIFDNEEEMDRKEKELVVLSENSYNLCEGGKGGFGYINKNKLWDTPQRLKVATGNRKKGYQNHLKKLSEDKAYKEIISHKISKAVTNNYKKYGSHWLGKKHKIDSIEKQKISLQKINHQQGAKNSQFGRPKSVETKRKISESLKRKFSKSL